MAWTIKILESFRNCSSVITGLFHFRCLKHTHTLTHTHACAHTHAHTHAQTHAHAQTHTRTHIHTHTHTHAQTHAQTHTHTHKLLWQTYTQHCLSFDFTISTRYLHVKQSSQFSVIRMLAWAMCDDAWAMCDCRYYNMFMLSWCLKNLQLDDRVLHTQNPSTWW